MSLENKIKYASGENFFSFCYFFSFSLIAIIGIYKLKGEKMLKQSKRELLNQKRKEVYLEQLESRLSMAKSQELREHLEKEKQYLQSRF